MIVNYVIYFICTQLFHWNWSAATILSWIGAVVFAYITNKIWVFESKTTGPRQLSREIALFFSARLVTLAFDYAIMFLCIELFHMDNIIMDKIPVGELIAKTIAQAAVIILNYIFSKWIIFKKKRTEAIEKGEDD